MSTYGNAITDWLTIGLLVSLAFFLIALAGIGLWKLMGPRFRLSMSVVLFSLMAAVVTVEAQKSGNAPMRIPWLEDLFQLSGVMMGNEMPTTVTEGLDLELGDSCGPITNPTNSTPVEALRFFGIAATSTNVWLGIEWPLGEVPSPLDLYGSWTLSPTYWTRLAELDVSSALSNAVVRHQWQLSCSNLVASGHWPTNATGSMGFFQLAKRLDSDGDQVLDGDETLRYGTDPLNPDTDGDGDSDGWEIDRGFDPCRQEPGINPYPLHSATTSEGGGNVPSGGSAVPEGGSACTNELKYGFFGFTTSFGGPEADYTGNDWPPANFGDGLPQISKDESHAYGTFIVSLSSRGWFRPSVTSNYVFSVAADDDAQFLIGGSGASVTWKNDGGNPAYFSVDLVGGVCYPVSVDWNTVGGPLFLTLTGGSVESAETGPYHPKIKADPHLITFTIAAGVALEERAATATIIGECDPDKRYEIAVEAGEGLAASGALAHPVEAGGYWEDGRFSVAVFRLLENGNEIDSDCCVFVSEPVKERNECGCCREGTVMDNGCVMFSQAFGSTPNRSGLPTGSVVVRASRPSASLYTAAALRYNHPMMRRLHYQRNLDAVVLDGLGEATEYRRGFPSGVSAGVGGQFFRDSNGRFVEELPDGLRVIYGDTGAVVALQPRNGEPVAVADLGITVARNADGDITAITSVTDGVMTAVTLNPQSSSPACPCWRLVWTSPVGAAVKRFDFGGSFAAGSFTLHEYRSERYQFDYRWDYDAALQDFVFEKGAGTTDALREEKTLAYNPVHKVWTSIRSRRDTDGNVISATSSVLDRNRHTLHATERRDVVSGKLLYAAVVSSAGWVALETNALGRITEYVRDQYGRVTRETIVAEGVPTEVREYGYTSDAYPLEFRPAWKRTSVGGSTTLEETFAYGTTSDGHSTITHVRSCCGASRTSFMEYDAAARPILAVGEDGRATLTNYSEPDADGVVVETADDGVLGDAGFIMVSGKSTREIRFRNAAGDVVRREQYALVDDDWRQLAWSTHAYNTSHREIATAHSDGTNSAADWICQGPVWCTDRNGVTVSNDYSAAKLLLRTTRYGAFGPVATQYTRNADGRIVAETTTAADCETQTVTRSYDSRGRVVSETAADGATTTTSYSADDRTKTTNYADGGTRIEVFNADGSTASVTGSAVTPEFTTYGVETIVVNGVANPCRTMTVRKGFANSPRCEKRFVNGFGETIRVETAGFGNAVNVQERCYDGNGRLVGQTETGRPSLAYTYDLFGGLAGETKTAGGESRMTVVDRSFVVEDGIVFESTATTRSCSDSAIVPLVEARRIRRSGLTLDENACTVDTDVRGNVTVRRVAVDPVNRRRVETVESPKVVNVATNWFVDGVSVSNVTSTGVCEQRTYDAYRRETARIDGRGNATMRNYNPLGRLARVVDASGAATSYAYDALGRVTEITNAVGNVTTRAYDHCGNLLAEGGAVYPVTYGYDVYGERVSLTTWRDVSSQIGDTTTWTRDAATGLVTAKTYADGHGPVYAYDAQGRQIQRTWARGIVTTYTYDSWGNLTGTVYSDDTPPVSRTYDALGRMISVTDVKGMTTYAYDAYGDVTSESVVGLYVKTLTRHHDQYGRDIGHSADGERTSTLAYDSANGRLVQAQLGEVSFIWSYLAGTDLKSGLLSGNSVSTVWTYEPQREMLTQVRNQMGTVTISQYDYVNDVAGRRTQIVKSGSAIVESRIDAYGYNVRNELVSATKNGDIEYVYSYDDIGNRLASSELGTNRTYTANSLNQYTAITAQGESLFQPVFDLDGNQTLVKTSTGIWTVTCNGENRPVQWTCGTTNITMKYDHMGRRVEYIEHVGEHIQKHHRFVYDGYLCIQRLDGANGNAVTDHFGWDPTEPIATRPLVWRHVSSSFTSTFVYTHDGNKNVSEVVSLSGAQTVSAHYDYSPFGETVSTQNDTDVLQMSATLNPWRFSSEYADDVTSADYYNYRHYVHNLGRWISYDREEYLSCLNLMGFLNNYPFVTDRLGCGFWDWFASLLGYVAPSPGSEAISSVEPMTKAAIVKAMADIKARIEFLTIQDPTMQNPCVIEEISRLEKRYRELAKMLSKFE